MKDTKNVSTVAQLSFVLLGVLMSTGSFAMGPKPPKALDYSAFHGHFQAVPSSECKDMPDFDFMADAAHQRITMKFSSGNNWVGQFEHINQGRFSFNSCVSDGIMGYQETAGSGTEIVDTTVYLNPGIFCSGGLEKSRKTTTIQLSGDTVTFNVKDTEFERNSFHCTYIRR